MPYDARTRDRHRLAVTATTGVVTVAALTATGFAAGQLAHRADQADQADQEAAADAQAKTSQQPAAGKTAPTQQGTPRLRERPTRTRVTTRYVSATTGQVLDRDSSTGSTQRGTAPAPAPAAPEPAPEPQPADPPAAPSSGS